MKIIATFFMIACASAALAAEKPAANLIGKTMAEFTSPDYLGAQHSSNQWTEKKAVVVVFLGTECPLAKLYGPRLAELAALYEPKQVQFVGINANLQDTLTEIAHYARVHKIEFPILKDAGNKVADQFGAMRTPEVYVLDQKRVVRYWGRIDDQYGVGYSRADVSRSDLAAALDELLSGKPVSTPVTEPVGCHISRVQRKSPTGDVTYSNQIARIFNQHCVRCHRPGEIAPFSLTSYDEVAVWAETIREVIEDQRMPPWHANPQHGKFSNDARMPDDDKELVFKWIDNGVPQGNPKDLPDAPKFIDGWQIPKPDLVVKMPQPYTVQAKGTVPYQYFYVDPGFKEDMWVRGSEGRPGNRQVVHHMVVFYLPPGQETPQPADPLFNAIAAFAPGMPPGYGDEGYAVRIPAGSKLVFQMHYTPNGTPQIDQSEAGLIFADPKKVKYEITVAAALNWQFRIPPGEPNYRIEATHRFPLDSYLYSLVPHMHLRGKSFRITAQYPDETQEILLDVPRYDFNWQNIYWLSQPKFMPEGTQLKCVANFDNSEKNLVNPDPTKTVYWGDQTWQEMMIGSFNVSVADQDLTRGGPDVKRLAGGRYEVRFRYRPNQPVNAVYVAGSFNDWKPVEHKMSGPNADGQYETTLTLPQARHEYKFVLDGKDWKHDPGNREFTGFFHNSVLDLTRAEYHSDGGQ